MKGKRKEGQKEGRKEERRKERREREEESHNFHQVTGFDLIGYIPLWKQGEFVKRLL